LVSLYCYLFLYMYFVNFPFSEEISGLFGIYYPFCQTLSLQGKELTLSLLHMTAVMKFETLSWVFSSESDRMRCNTSDNNCQDIQNWRHCICR
jgi:hypothetical protein